MRADSSHSLSIDYAVPETCRGSADEYFFVEYIANSMPPTIAGDASGELFRSGSTQDWADWGDRRSFRAGVRFNL